MQTVEFKEAAPGEFAPGTWSVTTTGELLFKCPECKKTGEMLNHSVQADGTVHASIACWPPCSHHVWGKFVGWHYPVKEAGQKVRV